jgi:predicted transcriptional regulator
MEDIEKVEVASNKMRLKFLKLLSESEDSTPNIAKKLGMERKTVAYHLLEKTGLMESVYKKQKNKGIVKNYKTSAEGKRIYEFLLSYKPGRQHPPNANEP